MVEATLDDVLLRNDTSILKHKLLVALRDAVPLHGEDQVDAWSRRAQAFPDELAKEMVRKFLPRYPLWVLDGMGVERSDPLYLHELLWPIIQNLYGTYLGLNRMYHPSGFKHLDRHVGRMQIAPPGLSERLHKVLSSPPPNAVRELRKLLTDTCELVEEHMPEVGTDKARRALDSPPQTAEG